MNNEEIVKIFVESVFLRIPYEEMKKRKLGEKLQSKPQNIELKKENSKQSIKDPINSTKNNQKNNPNININKTKKSQIQKYTPIKPVSNKLNTKPKTKNDKSPNINKKNILIPRTTKSTDKTKKKIKIKNESKDRKEEFNKRIKQNLFSEEKHQRHIIKNKKNKIYDNSLKLTKDLIKKQQEEIDFNRKFDYLKKRIETLKVKEEKIRLEKNYIQKKEIKIGNNLENKKKQKKMIEEFKKKENDIMKNRKETVKKIYENENRTLKNYGSALSVKNRKFFLQLKKEKEKLKKEKIQKDEELLKQRKDKMQLNKTNKNVNKEYNPNFEIQNNQKMNYIYSTKSIEYLKQNIISLEKLEKEYIKKIQEEKKGTIDVPPRKNLSARKSKNRYKLNKEEKNNLDNLDNKLEKKEKDYSIEAKDDSIINGIDIDNIKLETKISNKYEDDSLQCDNSQNDKKETKETKETKENIVESDKKESTPELITLDKIIVENK